MAIKTSVTFICDHDGKAQATVENATDPAAPPPDWVLINYLKHVIQPAATPDAQPQGMLEVRRYYLCPACAGAIAEWLDATRNQQ